MCVVLISMTSDELARVFGLSKIEKKPSAVNDDYSVSQNWTNEPQKDGKANPV